MAKKPTTYDLLLPPRAPETPAYQWLYAALRAEILDGRRRPGARLPGTRDLALRYDLSRGTIVAAFDQLRSEGYVEGSVGSGTYVSKVLPEDLLELRRKAAPASPAVRAGPKARLSEYGARIRPIPIYDNPRMRAFRPNVPALDLFPTELWAQVSARRLRRASAGLLLGCSAMGYPPLREAVADYLSTSRGVSCTPDRIAIVSGVQEGLDLVARLLLDSGDRVVLEDPGFPGAARVFEGVGAEIVAVPVDAEGMTLPREGRRGAGRPVRGTPLVYVTPAHQFPIGVTMSLRRRLELLEWARAGEAMVFEDDYDSEYRFSGRPIPSLQGLDRGARVILGGSFNKVLFPSLRMGYLVIPEDLVDRVVAVKSTSTRHHPLLDQAIVCDFIAEGHFARHIRRMRQVYADRLSVLMESGRRHLAGLLDLSTIEAGLQTVGWLREGIDDREAARAAAARNIEVIALSRYGRGRPARAGLQLGFAAVGPGEIRRGVRELAAALEETLKASRRARRRKGDDSRAT